MVDDFMPRRFKDFVYTFNIRGVHACIWIHHHRAVRLEVGREVRELARSFLPLSCEYLVQFSPPLVRLLPILDLPSVLRVVNYLLEVNLLD